MTAMLILKKPDIPSLVEAADCVAVDPAYPNDLRTADSAVLRKIARWAETPEGAKGKPGYREGIAAATVPFTRRNIDRLFKTLKPAVLGVEPKTLQNARSHANQIADRLGMPRGFARPKMTPECQRLMDLLKRHEDRGSCVRLLRFLSGRKIDPTAMSGDLFADFKAEVQADWRVADPDREWKRAIYAWNAAVKAFPEEWPQVRLDLPKTRQVWGKPWSFFPALEIAVDDYFRRRLPGSDLYDENDGIEVVSAEGQKASLRMVACALLYDGVPLEDLTNLRSLCAPDRFDRGIRALKARTGKVNATINKYARDLYTLAKYSGVLTKEERKFLKKSIKKWRVRHAQFNKTYEDRDQQLLDSLDNPEVCDKLLSLAQRTVDRVKRAKRRLTVGNAYAIERALLLELWLCAPIRIKNVQDLQPAKHFIEFVLDGQRYVALRLKGSETKNKNGEEHILNADTVALLDLYLTDYLPIILTANQAERSDYLFPGEGGGKKCYQAFHSQMCSWIGKNTGLKFHPHAIRKIVPKIILDVDPAAIEAAISAGGWTDDTMLRRIYGQRTHRATQKKYIELLESRRLTALGPLRRRKKSKR